MIENKIEDDNSTALFKTLNEIEQEYAYEFIN